MKKTILKCLTLLIILTLFLAKPTQALAEEKINSFYSTVTVNKDGTINVTETLLYDFGTAQKHGIFRTIPLIKTNNEGKKFLMDISVISVENVYKKQNQFTTSKLGTTLQIKIGDPNAAVTGQNTYKITYKVSGALTYFSDHDELFWQATGTEWEIPINSSFADIFLPSDLKGEIKALCYTGTESSTISNCLTRIERNKIMIASKTLLLPNEGLTFAVSFPKSYISVLEPTPYKPVSTKNGSGFIFVVFLWGIVTPLIVFLKWFKEHNKEKKAKVVAVWFDPPKDANYNFLSPAETKVLVDKDFDNKALSATLIHLAQRGYLKIRETKPKKFELVLLKEYKSDTSLQIFESTLLKGFFGGEAKAYYLSSKSYNASVASAIQKFKTELSTAVVNKKLFAENPIYYNRLMPVLAMFGFFTFNIPLAIVAWVFGRKAAKLTDLGIEKLGEAKSLKNFLVSQDEKLDFQAQNQMFFEKLLPYATAFGVENIWIKRFDALKMENPEWYEGNTSQAFAYAAFSHQFNNSINSAYRMTSTSSSSGFSSGFSGGGSTGGGGGGGGGGSW